MSNAGEQLVSSGKQRPWYKWRARSYVFFALLVVGHGIAQPYIYKLNPQWAGTAYKWFGPLIGSIAGVLLLWPKIRRLPRFRMLARVGLIAAAFLGWIYSSLTPNVMAGPPSYLTTVQGPGGAPLIICTEEYKARYMTIYRPVAGGVLVRKVADGQFGTMNGDYANIEFKWDEKRELAALISNGQYVAVYRCDRFAKFLPVNAPFGPVNAPEINIFPNEQFPLFEPQVHERLKAYFEGTK